MKHIDKIIFGDNQFFGINHLSETKARSQAKKFNNINNIINILDYVNDLGIKSFMATTYPQLKNICEYVEKNREKYKRPLASSGMNKFLTPEDFYAFKLFLIIGFPIVYLGLNDVFEIAAKYASSIALSHSLPDANKRTGLAVALEYLSLNDYELIADNELFADAIRDLVVGKIGEADFADLLYAQYISEQNQNS